jgi:peptidoglycan/LPS O-acetylase OafA/YrhL
MELILPGPNEVLTSWSRSSERNAVRESRQEAGTPAARMVTAPELPAGRILRVEAFRGIGAILVLWTHCLVVLPFVRQTPQSGLIFLQIMLLNGHLALMVFFVISGYVLGLSLDKGAGRPGNVRDFFIRRVFRIYPAHMVAVGVIALVLSTFDHSVRPAQASPLFGALFSTPVTTPEVFFNALLVRVGLNGITWSLAVEMAVSLVFPLFYLVSRHSSAWVRLGMLLGLLGLSMVLGGTSGNRVATVTIAGGVQGVRQPLLDILSNLALYGYVFYLGLIAEPFFRRLVPRLEGRWGTVLLWLALLVGLVGRLRLSLFVEVAGATVLVFCGMLMQTRNRITRALDHPFFVKLGTLSYSFYLYHLIVMYCMALFMFQVLPARLISGFPALFIWILLALSFFVTRAIAVPSYSLIEAPMLSYSLRLCRRLRRPAARVAPAVVSAAQPSD